MFRYASALLLALALVMLPVPVPGCDNPIRLASAHAAFVNGLPGTYQNATNGGYCYVQGYGYGRGYLFTNESGSQALFAYAGPGFLRMVQGDWDPSVTVSVSRDAYGRTLLRFDSPNAPSGYWVQVG